MSRVDLLITVVTKVVRAARPGRDDARVMTAVSFVNRLPSVVTNALQIDEDHLCCANCGGPSNALFCSELCTQEAGFVRYLRRIIADGRIADLGVLRDGIGTPLLMLRAGGYPTKARTVPPNVRQAIIERDHGRCRICRRPGNEIDHINGSSNDPSNLRLLCGACNGLRVHENTRLVEDPEEIAAIAAYDLKLAQRIAPESPLRVCDNEITWSSTWRSYRTKRTTTERALKS
jgi:5-methylcytosine-specific restriction endonuclease McrA